MHLSFGNNMKLVLLSVLMAICHAQIYDRRDFYDILARQRVDPNWSREMSALDIKSDIPGTFASIKIDPVLTAPQTADFPATFANSKIPGTMLSPMALDYYDDGAMDYRDTDMLRKEIEEQVEDRVSRILFGSNRLQPTTSPEMTTVPVLPSLPGGPPGYGLLDAYNFIRETPTMPPFAPLAFVDSSPHMSSSIFSGNNVNHKPKKMNYQQQPRQYYSGTQVTPPPTQDRPPFDPTYWQSFGDLQRIFQFRPSNTKKSPVFLPARVPTHKMEPVTYAANPSNNDVLFYEITDNNPSIMYCGGRKILVNPSNYRRIGCCGPLVYDSDRMLCLNGNIVRGPPEGFSAPPVSAFVNVDGQSSFKISPVNSQIAVEQSVVEPRQQPYLDRSSFQLPLLNNGLPTVEYDDSIEEVEFCGHSVYKKSESFCCSSELYEKVPGQICCENTAYAYSPSGHAKCCGILPYDDTSHICLERNVIANKRDSANYRHI